MVLQYIRAIWGFQEPSYVILFGVKSTGKSVAVAGYVNFTRTAVFCSLSLWGERAGVRVLHIPAISLVRFYGIYARDVNIDSVNFGWMCDYRIVWLSDNVTHDWFAIEVSPYDKHCPNPTFGEFLSVEWWLAWRLCRRGSWKMFFHDHVAPLDGESACLVHRSFPCCLFLWVMLKSSV